MKLNESTETHDSVSNATIQRVRNGKHIIIDWETNLLHVMRKEFLETDKCEFTLSKFKQSGEKGAENQKIQKIIGFFQAPKNLWMKKLA